MPTFKNFRYDFFTQTSNPADLTEVHQIEYHDEWDGYGIQLNEVPQIDNPSTVSIVEVDVDGNEFTGGTTFTEVSFGITPTGSEYVVDYLDVSAFLASEPSSFGATGRIKFSGESYNLVYVKVTFKGMGTTVKNRYPLNQISNIPTPLQVEGDILGTDDMYVGTGSGGGNIYVSGDPDNRDGVGNRDYNDNRYDLDIASIIRDPYFSKGHWETSDSAISFDGDYQPNTLKHTAGTAATLEYKPGGGNGLIPVIGTNNQSSVLWVSSVFRETGSYDGEVSFQIQQYDLDGVTLSVSQSFSFDGAASEITSTYRNIAFPLPILEPGTRFVSFEIVFTAGTTGTCHVGGCWLLKGSGAVDADGIRRMYSLKGSDIIMVTAGARDFQGYLPIYDASPITVSGGGFVSYDIEGTEFLPSMVKAVYARVDQILKWRDKDDNNYDSTSSAFSYVIPVYDYGGTSGRARLRMGEEGVGTTDVTIWGFLL